METEAKLVFGVVALRSSRWTQEMQGAGGPATAMPG